MTRLTADQLLAPPLGEAEVYLARWGGNVLLRELSGGQVLEASRHSMEEVPTSEGPVKVPNAGRYNACKLALALVEPSLGDTDALKIARALELQKLPYVETLLLGKVLEKLSECTLTDANRATLLQELPAVELLEQLGGMGGPGAVIAATPGEELDDLLSVALDVPEVLSGAVPSSIVRLLAARKRKAGVETAQMTARAILGLSVAPDEAS